MRQLAETKRLTGKLQLALTLSLTNLVALTIFGLLSLLFAAVDLQVSLVGLGLLAVAYNERRGRSQLVAADVRGPSTLALNQLALLAVVLLYCGREIYGALHGPDQFQQLMDQSPELNQAIAQLQNETDGALDDVAGIVRETTVILYSAAAGVSVLIQVLLALYYRSLRDIVTRLSAAPQWAKVLL